MRKLLASKNGKYLLFGAALIVVLGIAWFIYAGVQQSASAHIQTFDDCARAGYPVLQSYPRQCKVPGGKTFTSQQDVFDSTKNVACATDADCLLVNSAYGFSCCWAGACDAFDYSKDNWIAVNAAWFTQGQAKYCPARETCGGAPGCDARPINTDFKAACVRNACAKVPITR